MGGLLWRFWVLLRLNIICEFALNSYGLELSSLKKVLAWLPSGINVVCLSALRLFLKLVSEVIEEKRLLLAYWFGALFVRELVYVDLS